MHTKKDTLQVKIFKKHKSINPPCEFDFPSFSVLTGKNGSGKTHLLEAIANIQKSEIYINGNLVKNIRYIGFNGLNPNFEESCDPQKITQYIKSTWSQYNKAKESRVNNQRLEQNNLNLILRFVADENMKRYIINTVEVTGKLYDQLTEEDFADNFDISYMGHNDFFTAQFALIFKNYHRRQEENSLNEYYVSKGQKVSKPFLSKEDFENKYGIPPWEFVNKILFDTQIPYEVNSPVGTRLDSNFNFRLKDRIAGFAISPNDLSTGEKVLMSLALAIYNSGGDLGKPQVLLLDEPDAGLHPSMSKMMVDVLYKNIVLENKIPTIISTHLPTTIIASEGISIYKMDRGNSIPIKIPIQQAVEILSTDIPFLKISTDKRRQVFVESKYDVNYYELLTNILVRKENLFAEPIYLPARTSNGSNCKDVIDIVNNLYENGNEQVYGIIDWDITNKSDKRIIVLGENDRYSIENYLLDPFLLGLFFIRERKLNFSHFGLQSYSNYSEVGRLTINEAQQIVDEVLKRLKLYTSNIEQSKLYNGWTLNISTEFNKYQGHDLERLYKSTFPFLEAYRRDDQLKKEIIEKVINDYPEYSPRKLFEPIQKIK
jgi:ABC-type multidrug transport system ATPase subunit